MGLEVHNWENGSVAQVAKTEHDFSDLEDQSISEYFRKILQGQWEKAIEEFVKKIKELH